MRAPNGGMAPRLSDLTNLQLHQHQAADLMRALAAQHFSPNDPSEYFKSRWPRQLHTDLICKHFDEGFLEHKAVVAPGTTSDATWAQPLMAPSLLAGFLALVKASSVLGRLPVTPSPFNAKIVRQLSGSSTAWSGENTMKPVSKLGFGNLTLTWSKCLSLVVVTEELMRLTSAESNQQLQQTIKDEVVVFTDKAFLSTAAAVVGVNPAGILNGVTPITATADLAADLKTLVNTFFTNRPYPMAPVVILSPAVMAKVAALDVGRDVTMNGGTLYGLPVYVTPAALANAIVADAAAIYVADAGLDVRISREAMIEMVDTSAAPSASTIYTSLFQTNEIAIMCERYVHWLVAATNAVQFLAVA